MISPSSGSPDSAESSVSFDSSLEGVVSSVFSSVSSPSPTESESDDSSSSSLGLSVPSFELELSSDSSSDSSSPYGDSDHSPFSSWSKSSSSSSYWGIPIFCSCKRSCIASSDLENSYNSSAMATTSSQVSAAKHLSSMTCSSAVNCRVRKAPTLA